jgi:hypothetical protein
MGGQAARVGPGGGGGVGGIGDRADDDHPAGAGGEHLVQVLQRDAADGEPGALVVLL